MRPIGPVAAYAHMKGRVQFDGWKYHAPTNNGSVGPAIWSARACTIDDAHRGVQSVAEVAINYCSEASRGLNVTGARVNELQFPPDHHCPAHWHHFPSLGIVLNGEIRKKFAKASVVIRSGEGFTMPAGILHTDYFGPKNRVVVIEIDPDHPLSARRLEMCKPIFDQWMTFEVPQLRWLGQRLASELRRPDGATPLAMEGLIGEILSVATRYVASAAPANIPDWLFEAREIARTHITERVSVQEIAARVGVHPAYLARRFRAEFGVTPGAFARNARLHWAAERLLESDHSIAEIAIQAGFSDQSHFTRAFRHYVDQTPAQYRDTYSRIEPARR